jgi:hypothetical protein
MTWTALEGELITLNPQSRTPAVYHKKTINASDIQNLTIEFIAGDIVRFGGKTYDGETIEGVLSNESIIKIHAISPYGRDITEGDDIELIDLDEDKNKEEAK